MVYGVARDSEGRVIEPGDRVRDKVLGTVGTVTAIAFWAYGIPPTLLIEGLGFEAGSSRPWIPATRCTLHKDDVE